MATLTSANSVLSLGVRGVFDSPQTIQGFEVDDGVLSQAVARAEVRQGLDGYLAGGKVFNPYVVEVHLMPTSLSIPFFETVQNAQEGANEVFEFFGSLTIPGVNRFYTFTRGFMTSETPFAGVRKTLQPVVFQITFQDIVPNQF